MASTPPRTLSIHQHRIRTTGFQHFSMRRWKIGLSTRFSGWILASDGRGRGECRSSRVILQTARLLALGAPPALRLLVLREHVDTLLGDVERDAVNGPGLLKPKKLSVQIGVTHLTKITPTSPKTSRSRSRRGATRDPDVPRRGTRARCGAGIGRYLSVGAVGCLSAEICRSPSC